LAESDLSGNITSEYIYFGAQRIARPDVAANKRRDFELGHYQKLASINRRRPSYEIEKYKK
jgi:hypothetical protein